MTFWHLLGYQPVRQPLLTCFAHVLSHSLAALAKEKGENELEEVVPMTSSGNVGFSTTSPWDDPKWACPLFRSPQESTPTSHV